MVDRITLRLPDGMRQRLSERAEASLRSTNSEIIMILATALGDESKPATGEKFGDRTPAAGSNDPALQGGRATHR